MPTILVADDSLSVRKVAERLLKEAGLDVALAANGEEAMTWMSTQQPDLVIADVIMPDKSGFEVCAYVRSQVNLAHTPVLLVSGFVDDEVTRQAEACRADGVIKKPFQGASLRERVLELLAAKKEQPVAAPSPVPTIEIPLAAVPEPQVAVPTAPPSPAPTPVVMAAPTVATAIPAVQLAGEVRTLRETIQRLESRVAEQGKGLVHLDQQLRALQESSAQRLAEQENRTAQTLAKAQDLETRLAEAEKQATELRKRLSELEPAVASAKQLLQTLAEFARQSLKPDAS